MQRRASLNNISDRGSSMIKQLSMRSKPQHDNDVGTVASTATTSESSFSSPRSPSKRGGKNFLSKTFSHLGVFMDANSSAHSRRSKDPSVIGYSAASITSFEMMDVEMTPFELEMKAISLLSELRKLIKKYRDQTTDLADGLARHTDLALARNSGVGAIISMRKVKKSQEVLKRVEAVVGYLETIEMDLMSDIEEAKNTNLQEMAEFDWPVYDDFKAEAESMLEGVDETAWSDDELLAELDRLRSAVRRSRRRASCGT